MISSISDSSGFTQNWPGLDHWAQVKLKSLHWLPVHLCIHYKVLSLCYKFLNNSAPMYLSNSLHLYTPSRSLCSTSDPLWLHIPRSKLSTFGPRSFSVYGPSVWNTLPLSLRLKPSLSPPPPPPSSLPVKPTSFNISSVFSLCLYLHQISPPCYC